jgi:hypothetical protein
MAFKKRNAKFVSRAHNPPDQHRHFGTVFGPSAHDPQKRGILAHGS